MVPFTSLSALSCPSISSWASTHCLLPESKQSQKKERRAEDTGADSDWHDSLRRRTNLVAAAEMGHNLGLHCAQCWSIGN
jgi:hypothetical protein